MAVGALPMHMLTLLSVDKILLPSYTNNNNGNENKEINDDRNILIIIITLLEVSIIIPVFIYQWNMFEV